MKSRNNFKLIFYFLYFAHILYHSSPFEFHIITLPYISVAEKAGASLKASFSVN